MRTNILQISNSCKKKKNMAKQVLISVIVDVFKQNAPICVLSTRFHLGHLMKLEQLNEMYTFMEVKSGTN